MSAPQVWWQRPSTIVLALIFLPPVGIVLMYLFAPWDADRKKKAAIASGVWGLFLLILPKDKPHEKTKAPAVAAAPAKVEKTKAIPIPNPIPVSATPKPASTVPAPMATPATSASSQASTPALPRLNINDLASCKTVIPDPEGEGWLCKEPASQPTSVDPKKEVPKPTEPEPAKASALTAAETKKEAKAILDELAAMEKEGRGMEPLREAYRNAKSGDLGPASACGDALHGSGGFRDRSDALLDRAKALPRIPFSSINNLLEAGAGVVLLCGNCNKSTGELGSLAQCKNVRDTIKLSKEAMKDLGW